MIISLLKSLLEITLKPATKTIFFSFVKRLSNSYLLRHCTILIWLLLCFVHNFKNEIESERRIRDCKHAILLLMRIQYSLLWINFNRAFITSDNGRFAFENRFSKHFPFKRDNIFRPPALTFWFMFFFMFAS